VAWSAGIGGATLLDLGALESLVDAKGRTAHDVAVERKQSASVIEKLKPPSSPLGEQRVGLLDRYWPR